ncbi:MAG TPA: hypothetical protein DEA08_29700 [Planctomycetes bacterium]|nr:hypothetical protein [Planctomycetota bacterium]
MAKTIVLNFALKKLKAAEEAAKKILVSVRKSTDLSKEERRDRSKAARESLKEIRARRRFEQRRAKLQGRANALRGRDLLAASRGRFSGLFGTVGEAREKGESFANALFGDGEISQSLPSLISGVGQFVPGLGPFMTLLAPLTEKLLGHLEERLQQELAKQETRLLARLEEQRFRMDFTRRFKEDPAFAREQARQALERTVAEEARLGKRIQKTTADLVTDFGL